MREIIAKELTIVMVGKFNPVIINPNWLAGKSLISDLEAREAMEAINFITHPEVSQFKLPYCNVQTLQDRYTVMSAQEGYFDKISELSSAVFNFLKETPIFQMGINITHHYKIVDLNDWKKFGDTLAPKEIWTPITSEPGLQRLEIISKRKDTFNGKLITSVGVSELFPMGVRISVNDHYDLYSQEELFAAKHINATKALEVLNVSKQQIEASVKIINGIIDYDI